MVQRAAEILVELEAQHNVWSIEPDPDAPPQLALFDTGPHPVIQELRKLNVEEMSPIDAITRLYELKKKAERDS